MLSSGLDAGLKDMCIGERRRISLPATMGALDMVDFSGSDDRSIVYDVQLMGISDATTGATFKFLDLDGDKKISADEAESLVKMFMKALTTEIPGLDSATLG
ncbi:hypothetical protein HDE_10895 [Halotydeus destructor]|nr:hypothetical protein HDE_10895 [Halotydeus destructor]